MAHLRAVFLKFRSSTTPVVIQVYLDHAPLNCLIAAELYCEISKRGVVSLGPQRSVLPHGGEIGDVRADIHQLRPAPIRPPGTPGSDQHPLYFVSHQQPTTAHRVSP